MIVTYRRPHFGRCLRAVATQQVLANEALVMVRGHDREACGVLARCDELPIHEVVVAEPGVLAVMTAGVRATASERVAFQDDATRPAPDWLARVSGTWIGPAWKASADATRSWARPC